MNEIRQYKPISLVFYVDGNGNRSALPLEQEKLKWFVESINEKKMVSLKGIILNTYDIKEIRPPSKISEIEKYFYSREFEERAKITQRIKMMTKQTRINPIEELTLLGTERAILFMENSLKQKEIEIEKEIKTVKTTKKERKENLEKLKKIKEKFLSKKRKDEKTKKETQTTKD